jgi:hypothetical protein
MILQEELRKFNQENYDLMETIKYIQKVECMIR